MTDYHYDNNHLEETHLLSCQQKEVPLLKQPTFVCLHQIVYVKHCEPIKELMPEFGKFKVNTLQDEGKKLSIMIQYSKTHKSQTIVRFILGTSRYSTKTICGLILSFSCPWVKTLCSLTLMIQISPIFTQSRPTPDALQSRAKQASPKHRQRIRPAKGRHWVVTLIQLYQRGGVLSTAQQECITHIVLLSCVYRCLQSIGFAWLCMIMTFGYAVRGSNMSAGVIWMQMSLIWLPCHSF